MEITKNVSFSEFSLKRRLSRHNPVRRSVTVKIMYPVYEIFPGDQFELVRHPSVHPEPGLKGRRIRYTMTAAGTAGWSVVSTQTGRRLGERLAVSRIQYTKPTLDASGVGSAPANRGTRARPTPRGNLFFQGEPIP